MALAAEQELQHVGQTEGIANHDHDLLHELSRSLDALWRYDQYIANAEWRDNIRSFWEARKAREVEDIRQLKSLIKQEVENGCF